MIVNVIQFKEQPSLIIMGHTADHDGVLVLYKGWATEKTNLPVDMKLGYRVESICRWSARLTERTSWSTSTNQGLRVFSGIGCMWEISWPLLRTESPTYSNECWTRKFQLEWQYNVRTVKYGIKKITYFRFLRRKWCGFHPISFYHLLFWPILVERLALKHLQ